jgi:hypothetical protein
MSLLFPTIISYYYFLLLFPMEKGDNDELFGLLQFDTKSYKIYTDLIFRNMVKKLDKI